MAALIRKRRDRAFVYVKLQTLFVQDILIDI